ncbi:MAG: cytochrome c biogenesis protein ResB [Coriobacteriia bacterium]
MTHKVTRVLGSPGLATALLMVILVFSAFATFVPQGGPGDASVDAWSASHPVLGAVTQALGMHSAFTSPIFLACMLVLAVSTVVCSWRRTHVAIHRGRTLRTARTIDVAELVARPDARISCSPGLTAEQVLESAADEFDELGMRVGRHNGRLSAISPTWTVWGSPLFHWALVGFMVMIVIAGLVRADGLMGLAVGESKSNTPSSYGYLDSGPWHAWEPVDRQVRLDGFESEFVTGGLDRGPTPTISLLDAQGSVLKTQRVYPNNPLKYGSLTVHADDYGLAVRLSILDGSGATTAEGVQYVDFAADEPGGTRALGGVALRDASGNAQAMAQITVPLDGAPGAWDYWMPRQPSARLVVTATDGSVLEDSVVRPGEGVDVTTGSTLRVESVDWYYRLSVVDDGTTPITYVLLAVAFVGLTVSLVSRQSAVIAVPAVEPAGLVLAMRVRLWRNVPFDRDELVDRLTVRLGSAKEVPDHDA